MSDDRMRRDLGENIRNKVERILEQDFRIAQSMLPTDHLAMMAMEVCCSVSGALLLVPIQSVKDGADRDAFFDMLLGHVTSELQRARPRLFAALDAKMAEAMAVQGVGR